LLPSFANLIYLMYLLSLLRARLLRLPVRLVSRETRLGEFSPSG
jgi:hypothetical protein